MYCPNFSNAFSTMQQIILCALTGDSDYKGKNFTVTFPAGVNVISFNVTITDDNIAELAELFTLDLEIPDASVAMGVIKGSPDTATVNIMDDEGMCYLTQYVWNYRNSPSLKLLKIFPFQL